MEVKDLSIEKPRRTKRVFVEQQVQENEGILVKEKNSSEHKGYVIVVYRWLKQA